jgi:hypothetical protein
MNWKIMANPELALNLKNMVDQERELLYHIILCIREVDNRRLYLDLGYPSLFAYLTQELKYSESAAYRRIEAARLSRDVPEVIEKIQEGKISLTQVGEMAKALRQKPVSIEKKQELLSKIETTSIAKTQKILAQELEITPIKPEKKRTQQDESVRLEITLTKEQYEKLLRCKEDFSSPNLAETTSAAEVKIPKSVTPKLRRIIKQRDQCCQYRDPVTGKQCGSRFHLQVDHIQPKWANGSNDPNNLQLLCRAHNLKKYQDQAGIRRV